MLLGDCTHTARVLRPLLYQKGIEQTQPSMPRNTLGVKESQPCLQVYCFLPLPVLGGAGDGAAICPS